MVKTGILEFSRNTHCFNHLSLSLVLPHPCLNLQFAHNPSLLLDHPWALSFFRVHTIFWVFIRYYHTISAIWLADNCQRFSVRGDNCRRTNCQSYKAVRSYNCPSIGKFNGHALPKSWQQTYNAYSYLKMNIPRPCAYAPNVGRMYPIPINEFNWYFVI